MAIIQLFIGGTNILPNVRNKLNKKKELADASLKDKSVTIDRVLAARMRKATINEVKALSRLSMSQFRILLLGQGISTNSFTDMQLQEVVNIEIFNLRNISIQFLQADFLKSDTPIIISGTPAGALGLVAKVLGPTSAAEGMPIGSSVWWTNDTKLRIEAIHFSDKNSHVVVNP